MSLVLVSLIAALAVLTIRSNVVMSLGMVGALSIVRFRTAVKEPMDLAFMFWSITVGIICGAGIYEVVILGLAVIAIVIVILHFIPNVNPSIVLIVNGNDAEKCDVVVELVKKYDKSVQ